MYVICALKKGKKIGVKTQQLYKIQSNSILFCIYKNIFYNRHHIHNFKN